MMRSALQWCVVLCTVAVTALPAIVRASGEEPAPGVESPVGRWKTIDDASGMAKSIVAISEKDGMLVGRIEKLLDSPDDPNPLCTKCQGDLKDKPILGMQIMWDLRKDGEKWAGGRILDPDNGKTYKCSLALEDGGKKLKLRGYIGFSLLGRTQYWLRAD